MATRINISDDAARGIQTSQLAQNILRQMWAKMDNMHEKSFMLDEIEKQYFMDIEVSDTPKTNQQAKRLLQEDY